MSQAVHSYRVSIPRPSSHIIEVELRLSRHVEPGGTGAATELMMPVWCPGSYLVREFSRFIRNVRAEDGQGQAVAIEKTQKHVWRIASDSPADVIVRYQVYGHDLSVRGNHVDDTHAFLHGPALFLFDDSQRDSPVEIVFEVPEAWPVVTALPQTDGRYRAQTTDELLDSPFHIGPVIERTLSTEPAVRLAIWGQPQTGYATVDKLADDLKPIVETHIARFGSAPYPDYTFILMLSDNAYGGLEHCNSSANLHSPAAFAAEKTYEELLELLSHEFFHAWNGKRLFPESLGRFDYTREAYTKCLWVMEGITSYIDRYTVFRAGLMPAASYFERQLKDWARLTAIPGRFVQSLEESSFDAWIKLYRPNESNINTTVSYYLKGGLVAFALDLLIRQESAGAKTLDDVLRSLWVTFGAKAVPYPEQLEDLFCETAGCDLGGFFDDYIRGTKDPALDELFSTIGLRLQSDHGSAAVIQNRWLGAVVGKTGKVSHVLDGSPADRAGLAPSDEIIALDGRRVTGDKAIKDYLHQRGDNLADDIEVSCFRRGLLTAISVPMSEVAKAPASRYEIHMLEGGAAADAYQAWAGQEPPKPGKVASFCNETWV